MSNHLALSEDPRRDSNLLPSHLLCALLALRRRKGCCLSRGCFLGARWVLVVLLSRVVLRLAVGVVAFDVGGIVDARGMRSCVTFTSFFSLSA